MAGPGAAGGAAFTVGVTADRRWQEQARLLRDRGVTVVHGPTLRTVDLSGDDGLRATTAALVDRPPDYLIVTTGTGMRRWLEAAGRWQLDGPLLAGLAAAGTRVVARGAKAGSAARAAGLDVWWRAPQETMQEIVDHLGDGGLGRARVAVQVFEPGHRSTELLRAMSGELVEVGVYRWALPDDLRPAEHLVATAVAGTLDAVTFTAQPAVHNLFSIADRLGLRAALLAAFNHGVVAACVGPVCASAATGEGVEAPLWPDPPRLPAMVRQLGDRLSAAGSRPRHADS